MGDPIYRTVFTVEVFSRGRFISDCPPFDEASLGDIHYAISEGDCIGEIDMTSQTEVPSAEVHDHLIRIGNDGTFFEDDDGQD